MTAESAAHSRNSSSAIHISNSALLTDTASRSRRAFRARFGLLVPPSSSEGAGNAGRPMRPIAACAMVVIERTRVSQVTPESPGIPRAMVYGLLRALPGDRLSCHRRPRKLVFANLTPAPRRQNHTTSPSASRAIRQRRIRVHRVLSRVRDDLEPPLCGTGRLGLLK
jgi:hypothetical protein